MIAWSSILAGALFATMAGCSATPSTTGVQRGAGGSGNASSGGSGGLMIDMGGRKPVGTAGTIGDLGGGDPGTSGGGMGGACQTGGADFVPKVPTVMLLVDRSGTMFINQGNPWGTLRGSVRC
ncbi:MAG TPA: hypothetical protein VEQ58_18145 [Polyangiaceae bacterium]|nr:hypothetical protein [Polyangiaceae bacterium]